MTAGVLLPYQQRWIADTAAVRVAEKSRRIGLSWAMAAEAALTAAREHGQDTWYVGYNKEMAMEFVRDAGDWSRAYNFAVSEIEEYQEVFVEGDEEKAILAYRITFASGFRVSALSSRPSNLRGKQGLVVLDEAAFHQQLKELLKAALALLIWGGRVAVISTHDGVDNPFNELCQDVLAGKFPYSLHRITLDDALRDGLYRQICLTRGLAWSPDAEAAWRAGLVKTYGEDAQEELFCIPKSSGGAYLSRSMIEAAMEPRTVLRFEVDDAFTLLPDEERAARMDDWIAEHLAELVAALDERQCHWFGMDFGRTGDLSALWPIAQDQMLRKHTPFLVEMRNTPFKQQEQLLFWVVDRLPRFIAGAMDGRGNGQYLSEVAMQRYGEACIAQVMLSQEWYRVNMPRYKAALEDRDLTIPKDADVLADHRLVVVENGVPKVPANKHTTGADGKQRHGDTVIAGALAWYATGLEVAPAEFESTGEVRASYDVQGYLGGSHG